MFENLNVNEAFRSQIESAFSQGRLSHALIFEGSSEETRLKAAKELAKAVLCNNINAGVAESGNRMEKSIP